MSPCSVCQGHLENSTISGDSSICNGASDDGTFLFLIFVFTLYQWSIVLLVVNNILPLWDRQVGIV